MLTAGMPVQLSEAVMAGMPRETGSVFAVQSASAATVMSAGQVMVNSGAVLSSTTMVWTQVAVAVLPQWSVAVAVHVRSMIMLPAQGVVVTSL